MFIFSTIKCELIKQLYNINLRRLPSQHGEVSVMFGKHIDIHKMNIYNRMERFHIAQTTFFLAFFFVFSWSQWTIWYQWKIVLLGECKVGLISRRPNCFSILFLFSAIFFY